ncbi:MAG: CDP-alcohol phosphatidyltransferase family protein [Rhodobacteraceae bacterium]|nr:CDP-alcohol phosphatidyltransferase family protein [Paracoccaceae bacterium]
MLDAKIRPLIDGPLNRVGVALAERGIAAHEVTLFGLFMGLLAAALLAAGLPGALALVPLALGRLADGLDGAVARATEVTDFGGFLDILCDFAFYAAVPLAFALRDDANGAAAAFLLAAFYINGASFLGFAIMAQKRGLETKAQGIKSLYYSAGLLEGTETIAFFVVLCLWPDAFGPLAVIFAILCLFTTVARAALARRVFG